MAKKNLVIIESPSKAHTIQEALGSGYKVIASKGHVRDLPKSQFGIDIDDGFKPRYINIRGKGDTIKELKKEAKAAGKVFLATDPDREGEAISWHLANVLGIEPENALRVTFNELTKSVIKTSVKNPRAIDMNLVNAQQTRRILDRIVGYKLSPLLWLKIQNGLSAGRVQSVATRLVVEREREISAFVPEEYWTVAATLSNGAGELAVRYVGETDGNGRQRISDGAFAEKVADDVKNGSMKVALVKHGIKEKNPQPPFTTSTMQQEASKRLGFRSDKIMTIAQELYEGINLGAALGGTQGLITYMRTDSLRVSAEAQSAAADYIASAYGPEYNPAVPRVYKTRSGAQDAHEAIRPTQVALEPASIKKQLTPDQYKLYKLIWERFVASQMASAKLDTVSVDFECAGHVFRAGGYTVVFRGYSAVGGSLSDIGAQDEAQDDADSLVKNLRFPQLTKGDMLSVKTADAASHFTEPPARYTEATLIKALEEKGIGRPSTITPTITTIVGRKYVKRDGKSLVPTELGFDTTALMENDFADIVNYDFTANLENSLDGIENGTDEMSNLLSDFWSGFEKELNAACEKEEEKKAPVLEETDIICDKCGARMVVKTSRRKVKFAACPNYPKCRNTRSLDSEGKPVDPAAAETAKAEPELAGFKCELCGGEMVRRKGPYGTFFACINFPACRFSKTEELALENVACPKCGGRVIIRHGKRKTTFYSCEHYPECDFSSWMEPTSEKCPECGAMLFKRKGKGGGFKCSDAKCGYSTVERKADENAENTDFSSFFTDVPSLDYEGENVPMPSDDDAPASGN
ncbi:MAG: type I DNA topoisomerase [Clostridia bacterium]|nr:type I DNA topoisomerase [Clostridia bacterium]